MMDAEPALWDSELEDFLEQATRRPSMNEGRAHVFIGDSIAQNAPVGVSEPCLFSGSRKEALTATVGEDI